MNHDGVTEVDSPPASFHRGFHHTIERESGAMNIDSKSLWVHRGWTQSHTNPINDGFPQARRAPVQEENAYSDDRRSGDESPPNLPVAAFWVCCRVT